MKFNVIVHYHYKQLDVKTRTFKKKQIEQWENKSVAAKIIMSELFDKVVSSELFRHNIDNHIDISEDFHSTQVKKSCYQRFYKSETLSLWARVYSKCGK